MKKEVLLLILWLFFCASLISAGTINVPGDYANIQDAIDNATAGDTINVSAGTYVPSNLSWDGTGFLRINKSITLKGAGSGLTIIDGQHLHSVISGYDNIHSTCLWLESSNVNLDGLTIKGCDWGIRVSNIYVPAVTEISDLNFNDVTVTDNYGHGIVFEKNTVLNLVFKRVDFVDCNANANGDRGIYLNPGSIAENFTLTNTNANDNKKSGFNCQGNLNGLTINGGTFNNNTGGPINDYGTHYAGPYFGAGLELDGVSNAEINGIEANRNGLLGPYWCNMTGGAGILLKDETSNVQILNSELNNNVNGILVEYCAEEWSTGSQPSNIELHYNGIVENTNYGISNRAPLSALDAQYNWWGDCKGPGPIGPGNGDAVSTNVTYEPWLGICISNKTNVTCAFESNNVTLSADLNGTHINSCWIAYTINGTNYNKTGSIISNKCQAIIPFNELIRGMNVTWNVYVKDDYEIEYSNGEKTFYVRKRTALIVNPLNPGGLNGWYLQNPDFSFIKDILAGSIYYKWDSTGDILYTGEFSLENAPNNQNVTGGIAELNWWTDFEVCGNETEQSQMFYIDLTNPLIKNLKPASNSIVYNNLRPEISAYLDEVYQSNSGINKGSVIIKVDGVDVTNNADVSYADELDAIVSYTPTSDLSEGQHNVTVNVSDKAGRNSELTWKFNINITPVFTMVVYSPKNIIYNSKRAQFNISLSEKIEKIEYINWNDKKPRWKKLCGDCDEYGYDKKRIKTLNERENNLTIKATDYFGQTKEENISLFIDSIKPKISKTEPRRNSVINGSEFYIEYTEDNLRNITLFWNPSQELIGCPSGKNQECRTFVNLSAFDGKWIEYYFEVSDLINTIQSKTTRVFADTTSPMLNITLPITLPANETYGRKVPFNITVSEDVLLEYIDNSVTSPRWRRLTSNNDEYGNTRKKTVTFKRGNHDVLIRAVDKAGNSDIKEVSFNVDY